MTNLSRRSVLALAAIGVSAAALGATKGARAATSFVTAKDGTKLFYQETGQGDPVVFVHGWSMNSDVWRGQFAALSAASLRCIGYDRRGHGRSDRAEMGFDDDTLSDDLAVLLDRLDLNRVTLVGHSMGGGEAARYLTRHGNARVARVVLLAPTLPFLLQRPDNANGIPLAVFDKLRAALKADYAKYIRDNAHTAFVAGTPQDVIEWGIGLSLQCAPAAAIACTHTYSETDFRGELGAIATPTLILHGDADQLPIELTSRRATALIKGSTLKIYPGAPHVFFVTHSDAVNADLLAFIRA